MSKTISKAEIIALYGVSSATASNHIKKYREVFEVVDKDNKKNLYSAAKVKKHFKEWVKTSAAKTTKRKPKLKLVNNNKPKVVTKKIDNTKEFLDVLTKISQSLEAIATCLMVDIDKNGS